MKQLKYTFYLFIFLFSGLSAKEKENSSPTICLNMIVKNESQVIERCLTSLLPIIDYWVIVDTGSSDGTQKVIKDFMKSKKMPGELHERPWVNFAHNRNEALQLAKNKADYTFFIDADEYLTFDQDFKLPQLDKDYYFVTVVNGDTKYGRVSLINNKHDWKWVGVLHEVLCPPPMSSCAQLQKVQNVVTYEGARSKDPLKYQKDAEILEAALKNEPDNMRYVFYLAQSYRDAGNNEKALQYYEKRVAMGGWEEEVFWSLLQIGLLQEKIGLPTEKIIETYQKAFQYRSSRVEPLYYMANLYRRKGDYQSGYQVAKIAQTVPTSQDLLFIQEWMNDYGVLLELSICAYWLEKYEECQQISLKLLERKNLPPHVHSCVEKNLGYANTKLIEQVVRK